MAWAESDRRVRVVKESRERLVAGLNGRFTPDATAAILEQWERFRTPPPGTPGVIPGAWYGVCHNYRADGGFEYLCGVEYMDASKVPPGTARLILPAIRYAAVHHRGHVSTVTESWRYMYDRWLPAHPEWRLAEGPRFELYGPGFDPETGQGGFEIWFPVEAAG